MYKLMQPRKANLTLNSTEQWYSMIPRPFIFHIKQFMCTRATQCKRETTVGADFTAVSQKTDQLFLHVPSGARSAAEQRQSSVILPTAHVVKLSCENSIWLSRNSLVLSSSRFVLSVGSNRWHSSKSFLKSSVDRWA